MYACTGASPSPFAICGLPPARRAGVRDAFAAAVFFAAAGLAVFFAAGFLGAWPAVFAALPPLLVGAFVRD
jgi:hypothetical protein